jgi:predicted DNA-binding transcriptional regulator YafY
VEVEFTGWAAGYVTERIWSLEQKVIEKKDGKIKLSFTASSEPELIAWLLSFGDEAKLIKPDWLVEEVRGTVKRKQDSYS